MAIPKNRVDRAWREDAVHEAILAGRREKRTLEVRLARQFLAVERSAHFVYESCVSVAEYGARFGYSPQEAKALVSVGAVLEAMPDLEGALLDGRLSFDALDVVSKILLHPSFAGARGDWVKLAEGGDLRALRREVRKALAEEEAKQALVAKTIYLTPDGEQVFFEARCKATRFVGHALSEGETVEFLSRKWLDGDGDGEPKPGKRRLPPTKAGDPRTIPEEVKREVRARTRGKCAVWGCWRRAFTHFAHLFPHADGGNQEAENIALLCPRHHALYDKGLLRIEGTAENPIFRDVRGNLLPGDPGSTGGRGPPGDGQAGGRDRPDPPAAEGAPGRRQTEH